MLSYSWGMTSNKRGCEAQTPSLVPPIEASPLLIYSHFGRPNGGVGRPSPNEGPNGGVGRPSPNEGPNGGVGRPSPNEGPNGGVGRPSPNGARSSFGQECYCYFKRRSRSGRRVGQDFEPRHVEEMVG